MCASSLTDGNGWALADDQRAARDAADLTQAELADRLGVTRRAVQTWEQGIVVPRAKHRRLVKAWLEQQEQAA